MLYFERFYYQHGVRRVNQIASPPINPTGDLGLPVKSIYHYLSENTAIKGMPSDHWVVRQSKRLIIVDHVETLAEDAQQGNPRRTVIQPETEIRGYHQRHRRLKRARNLTRDVRDDLTPLVVNYALLDDFFRYTPSRYSRYYQEKNIVDTLFARLGQYESMNRHQFVPIGLPTPLPSLSDFRRAEKKMSQDLIETFNSFEDLMILELWKWLGEDRSNSALEDLSDRVIGQTNLLIHYYGQWILVNLGRLNQWRQSASEDSASSGGGIPPDALQKRFLRMLMTLFDTATPQGDDADETDDDASSQSPQKTHASASVPEDRQDTPEEIRQALGNAEDDATIEQDLNAIKDAKAEESTRVTTDPFTTDTVESLGQGVTKRAASLASQGLITPAEYRRFEKLGNAYQTMNNPYTGQGTIEEASVVSPEDVAIDGPTVFPDDPGVVDKEMLKTTLQNFDQRYVNNVLPKDIMGGVLNLNRAGVAVTDYEVEDVEDVANAYEIHTVRVTPVRGKSSTLRFKIPKVNEKGEWVANGVSYRMRRQRADFNLRSA